MKIEETDKRNQIIGNIIVLIIMVVITIPYIANNNYFGLIDYVNLAFHEAGHFILGISGNQFILVCGGTLGQLFVPGAFAVYFFIKKDYRAFLFTLFWFFQNFINISIYMADAPYQNLPLLGGDGTVHDWVYLCGELRCLHLIENLAKVVRVAGTLGMIASIMALGLFIFDRKFSIYEIKS